MIEVAVMSGSLVNFFYMSGLKELNGSDAYCDTLLVCCGPVFYGFYFVGDSYWYLVGKLVFMH